MKKTLSEEKDSQEAIDKNQAELFLKEYQKLSDKYGFDIAAEMVYGTNGIGCKLVISKKPQDA